MKFYPYKKGGGAEQVLAMLKGEAQVLAIVMGRGMQKVSTL